MSEGAEVVDTTSSDDQESQPVAEPPQTEENQAEETTNEEATPVTKETKEEEQNTADPPKTETDSEPSQETEEAVKQASAEVGTKLPVISLDNVKEPDPRRTSPKAKAKSARERTSEHGEGRTRDSRSASAPPKNKNEPDNKTSEEKQDVADKRKDTTALKGEYEPDQRPVGESAKRFFSRVKTFFAPGVGDEPKISTTRPRALPPKDKEEEERHLREHEEMMRKSRDREERDRAIREEKKKLRERRVNDNIKRWKKILPTWQKSDKENTRDMWWPGLPSNMRGDIWLKMAGNELHINPELYGIHLKGAERARREMSEKGKGVGKEDTVLLIPLDLPRTFPALSFFSVNGPYHPILRNVLEAYVCFRPDIGYVQGMSYLAAILLLNVDECSAFMMLANMLNRRLHVAFYSMKLENIEGYYTVFQKLLDHYLPKLSAHLTKVSIPPELYLLDWVLTLFAKTLPLDVVMHVWDVYLMEGEPFIFRVGLALLKLFQTKLMRNEMEGCLTLICSFSSQEIEDAALFKMISSIELDVERYNQLCKEHLAKC